MSVATLLTLAGACGAPAVQNHRAYCHALGYRHVVIDVSSLPTDLALLCQYQFQVAWHWLSRLPEGELLAVLTDEVVVLQHKPLSELMEGRDILVGSDYAGKAMTPISVWRQNEQGRRLLTQALRRAALGNPGRGRDDVLLDADAVPWNQPVAGVLFCPQALHFADPVWLRVPTFCTVMGAIREAAEHQGIPWLLRDAVIQALELGVLQTGVPQALSSLYAVPSEPMSVFNPHRPIALVMLYTPNIAAYGQIAETRLREYAEQCGYTAYIYRAIPQGCDAAVSGNWVKPWLLHEQLKNHEWVFWVDADVLVQSTHRRLEDLLAGRNFLVTWDVGGWRLNSGIVGLRNTAENFLLLDDLMRRTQAVHDKSGVYTNGGDQSVWIAVFEHFGLTTDEPLVDVLTLNTPWYFQQPDSFMVHYFAIWNDVRALMMHKAYSDTAIKMTRSAIGLAADKLS